MKFNQVKKKSFDQTPNLTENFDQLKRSSEIWSSECFPLLHNRYNFNLFLTCSSPTICLSWIITDSISRITHTFHTYIHFKSNTIHSHLSESNNLCSPGIAWTTRRPGRCGWPEKASPWPPGPSHCWPKPLSSTQKHCCQTTSISIRKHCCQVTNSLKIVNQSQQVRCHYHKKVRR